MSWSQPQDLKAQLQQLWQRGELLRDAVTGYPRFPLRLALKTPSSAEITHRFAEVREWTAQLSALKHARVEWQTLRHRVHGNQTLPSHVIVETLDHALTWLGKRDDWARFGTQIAATRKHLPALLPWLERRPLQALELFDDWPRLLSIVQWLLEHPRPGIYLRQVDLPGIHSKFIETHRGVLTELLDLALPADAIDVDKAGASQFVPRYGFLQKPAIIRFRSLDPAICLFPGLPQADISLDSASLAQLAPNIDRVFIAENETNYLAFPNFPRALLIFGKGYGWSALAQIHWLHQYPIHYWGDIDNDGFAILNELRHHFPHVQSLLMDRETLNAHRDYWGHKNGQKRPSLQHLNQEELSLYNDLCENRIQPGLRLEQEHIGFHWLAAQLEKIAHSAPRR